VNGYKKTGNRTPMAIYQSMEKVGSALGPIVFGTFAAYFGINMAIGLGGVLYLVTNAVCYILYKDFHNDQEHV